MAPFTPLLGRARQGWRRLLLWGFVGVACTMLTGHALSLVFSRDRIFQGDVASCPERPVALLLGCAPWSRTATERVQAAAALYHADRVRHILVSGDNSRMDYDEPTALREALLRSGVPAAAITRDYAGLRTLDSVVRAKAIFGLDAVVIVSSDFHLPRAILLARAKGLDAVAYAAPSSTFVLYNSLRESLARAVAWVDLCSGRSPRFYGAREPIPGISRFPDY